MVEFYYHDNKDTPADFTKRHNSGIPVSASDLEALGVKYYYVEDIEKLNKIAEERKYENRDQVALSLESFGGDLEAFDKKMKQFYEEHFHEDEEIRYVVEGEGYFDVRDKKDRWVRALLQPHDLLILPAGIYHRFTLSDEQKYTKAIRLFKDEPKWEAINRKENRESSVRESYANLIAAA